MSVGTLSRHLPIPLYKQLKSLVLESIRTGALKPDDQLLAESELARQYEVSKATVRQALDELEREGILYRIQGRGTFVARARVDLGPSYLDSFTVQMEALGRRPSSHVLEQMVLDAEGEVAERLSVRDGSAVFRLKRLRLADGEPMGLQVSHIPLELAPDLEKRDFRKEGSLYAVLEKDYGLIPARALETHSAVILEPDEADLLLTAHGAAALASRRLTLLVSGRPMELVFSWMRGDRYRVVLELSATEPPRAKPGGF